MISSTPPREAASAGQVVVGLAASEPWLIELPWGSHELRPSSGTTSTGASRARGTRAGGRAAVSGATAPPPAAGGPSPPPGPPARRPPARGPGRAAGAAAPRARL